jgi:hypothetical protein
MHIFARGSFIALSVLGLTSSAAIAQEAPPSWVASPDVYKVIGENAKYRIILATWKPGQIDNPHSHKPGQVIAVTDCLGRNHPAGGPPADRPLQKAGQVTPLAAIASHQNENIGTADCQIVLIEEK